MRHREINIERRSRQHSKKHWVKRPTFGMDMNVCVSVSSSNLDHLPKADEIEIDNGFDHNDFPSARLVSAASFNLLGLVNFGLALSQVLINGSTIEQQWLTWTKTS